MYNIIDEPHYSELAVEYDNLTDAVVDLQEQVENYGEVLSENIKMSQFLLEAGYNNDQRHAIKNGHEVNIEPVDKGKFDLMKIRLELSDIKVLLKEKS